MADLIVFNCPYCNQSLDAPEELAGQDGCCPACKQAIVIPAAYNMSETPAGGITPPETSAIQPGDGAKSSTIRIDIGDEMILPKAKPRVFKIKRPDRS